MKRRSPLMGFTEAELGFIIAAVIAATATMTSAESQPPVPPVPDTAVVASIVPPPAPSDSVVTAPGKRDELPYCSQLGLEVSPLPPIAIVDAARYRVNGKTINLAQLKAALAPAIAQSTERQCKYKLFFRVRGDLPHRVVRKAKSPFFARFYISDAG